MSRKIMPQPQPLRDIQNVYDHHQPENPSKRSNPNVGKMETEKDSKKSRAAASKSASLASSESATSDGTDGDWKAAIASGNDNEIKFLQESITRHMNHGQRTRFFVSLDATSHKWKKRLQVWLIKIGFEKMAMGDRVVFQLTDVNFDEFRRYVQTLTPKEHSEKQAEARPEMVNGDLMLASSSSLSSSASAPEFPTRFRSRSSASPIPNPHQADFPQMRLRANTIALGPTANGFASVMENMPMLHPRLSVDSSDNTDDYSSFSGDSQRCSPFLPEDALGSGGTSLGASGDQQMIGSLRLNTSASSLSALCPQMPSASPLTLLGNDVSKMRLASGGLGAKGTKLIASSDCGDDLERRSTSVSPFSGDPFDFAPPDFDSPRSRANSFAPIAISATAPALAPATILSPHRHLSPEHPFPLAHRLRRSEDEDACDELEQIHAGLESRDRHARDHVVTQPDADGERDEDVHAIEAKGAMDEDRNEGEGEGPSDVSTCTPDTSFDTVGPALANESDHTEPSPSAESPRRGDMVPTASSSTKRSAFALISEASASGAARGSGAEAHQSPFPRHPVPLHSHASLRHSGGGSADGIASMISRTSGSSLSLLGSPIGSDSSGGSGWLPKHAVGFRIPFGGRESGGSAHSRDSAGSMGSRLHIHDIALGGGDRDRSREGGERNAVDQRRFEQSRGPAPRLRRSHSDSAAYVKQHNDDDQDPFSCSQPIPTTEYKYGTPNIQRTCPNYDWATTEAAPIDRISALRERQRIRDDDADADTEEDEQPRLGNEADMDPSKPTDAVFSVAALDRYHAQSYGSRRKRNKPCLRSPLFKRSISVGQFSSISNMDEGNDDAMGISTRVARCSSVDSALPLFSVFDESAMPGMSHGSLLSSPTSFGRGITSSDERPSSAPPIFDFDSFQRMSRDHDLRVRSQTTSATTAALQLPDGFFGIRKTQSSDPNLVLQPFNDSFVREAQNTIARAVSLRQSSFSPSLERVVEVAGDSKSSFEDTRDSQRTQCSAAVFSPHKGHLLYDGAVDHAFGTEEPFFIDDMTVSSSHEGGGLLAGGAERERKAKKSCKWRRMSVNVAMNRSRQHHTMSQHSSMGLGTLTEGDDDDADLVAALSPAAGAKANSSSWRKSRRSSARYLRRSSRAFPQMASLVSVPADGDDQAMMATHDTEDEDADPSLSYAVPLTQADPCQAELRAVTGDDNLSDQAMDSSDHHGLNECNFHCSVVGGTYQQSFDGSSPVIAPPMDGERRVIDARIEILANGESRLRIVLLSPSSLQEVFTFREGWQLARASPQGFLLSQDAITPMSKGQCFFLTHHPNHWQAVPTHAPSTFMEQSPWASRSIARSRGSGFDVSNTMSVVAGFGGASQSSIGGSQGLLSPSRPPSRPPSRSQGLFSPSRSGTDRRSWTLGQAELAEEERHSWPTVGMFSQPVPVTDTVERYSWTAGGSHDYGNVPTTFSVSSGPKFGSISEIDRLKMTEGSSHGRQLQPTAKTAPSMQHWSNVFIVTCILDFLSISGSGKKKGGSATAKSSSRVAKKADKAAAVSTNCSLVCKAWAIASFRLLARRIATGDLERVGSWARWAAIMKKNSVGAFLSSGACKQVYAVRNENHEIDAISVMDIDDLNERDAGALVAQEIEISLLCSSLVTLNICPNLVVVRSIFQSSLGVSASLWGKKVSALPTARASSLPPQSQVPQGNYQFIRMEFCKGGDLEDLVRKEILLDPTVVRSMLFQMCFSLFASRDRLALRHFDIKLLNFFVSTGSALLQPSHREQQQAAHSGKAGGTGKGGVNSFQPFKTAQGKAGTSGPVALRIGFGRQVYTMEMQENGLELVKLADFGTSAIGARGLGDPITVDQFTTLENTPPEFFFLGSAARQAFSADTFCLGLSYLHLLTGHEPYEELLKEVVCPAGLRAQLEMVWLQSEDSESNPYKVIRDLVDSLEVVADEDDRDTSLEKDTSGDLDVDLTQSTVCGDGDAGKVLFDTMYRYCVLFARSVLATGAADEVWEGNPVWAILKEWLGLDTEGSASREGGLEGRGPEGRGRGGRRRAGAGAVGLDPAKRDSRAQFEKDTRLWCLQRGNHRMMTSVRERLALLGPGAYELLVSMIHFDPSRRCTMREALSSAVFAPLRETVWAPHRGGAGGGARSSSYMHYLDVDEANLPMV